MDTGKEKLEEAGPGKLFRGAIVCLYVCFRGKREGKQAEQIEVIHGQTLK